MLKHHISKKTMALMLLFTLVFSCICLNTETVFAKKTVYSYGSGSYTIISEKWKTVQYEFLSEKSYTVAEISATVELKGKKYSVTQIAANALANSDRIKKAVIGKNITKIGKKAFYNCKYSNGIACRQLRSINSILRIDSGKTDIRIKHGFRQIKACIFRKLAACRI